MASQEAVSRRLPQAGPSSAEHYSCTQLLELLACRLFQSLALLCDASMYGAILESSVCGPVSVQKGHLATALVPLVCVLVQSRVAAVESGAVSMEDIVMYAAAASERKKGKSIISDAGGEATVITCNLHFGFLGSFTLLGGAWV